MPRRPLPEFKALTTCPESHQTATTDAACPRRRSGVQRWLLATIGILSCGLGLLGVFVPGLPTTVFVIIASYCFTRSCPWLEDRLLRNRLFARSMRYVDGDLRLTAAHRTVISLVIVLFTGSSVTLLAWSGRVGGAGLVAVAVFGAVGVLAVWLWRRDGAAAGRDDDKGSTTGTSEPGGLAA